VRDLVLVAGREIRQALRLRSFWIVIAVLVVGSSAAMIIPELVSDGRTTVHVTTVDVSPTFEASLRSTAESLDVDVEIDVATDVDAARQAVDDEQVDVAAIAGDEPAVVARSGPNELVVGLVQQALGISVLADRLEAAGLTAEEAQAILASPPPQVDELDSGGESRAAAAAIVATVLYIILLMLMIGVATGTAIEKSNRISEVLLAIVKPGSLLFGKVIGVGLTGMATLLAGILPVVVKLTLGGDLPDGLAGALLGGAPWILLGLAFYLTVAGALGALVERQEEAGSVVTPLTLLLVGTLIIAQSAADSPLGAVLAYVPFTAPLVMPARIALGVAEPLEMAVSIAICLGAVLLAARFGSVVYRRAIVHTGNRLKLREVLRPARAG
jgi:ABC-2 type transport system permease protein